MLVVHVQVRIVPGRTAEFLAATVVNARASLGESGVLRFDVIQDQADPEHVVLVEVYRDADASAAHKATPHYAVWRDAVAEMMAEPRQSTRFSAVFPDGAASWIVAQPKSANLAYTKVEFLATPEGEIHRVLVTGQDQSKLDFTFSGERLNPSVAPSLFAFHPPPGVQIVEAGQ